MSQQNTPDEMIDQQAIAQVVVPPVQIPEPPTNEVRMAMVKAWGEFDTVGMDAKNNHSGNKYATLDAVVREIRPAMAKHGLMPSQSIITHNDRVEVQTTLNHSSGQFLTFPPVVLPVTPHRKTNEVGPQEFASAVTYARRYSILAALGITTGDDDDGNMAQGYQQGDRQPPKARGSSGAGANRVRAKLNVEPQHKPFGDDRAIGLENHAKANGITMNQIRDHLVESDYADLAEKEAAEWPEVFAPMINEFISKNAVKEEEPKTKTAKKPKDGKEEVAHEQG